MEVFREFLQFFILAAVSIFCFARCDDFPSLLIEPEAAELIVRQANMNSTSICNAENYKDQKISVCMGRTGRNCRQSARWYAKYVFYEGLLDRQAELCNRASKLKFCLENVDDSFVRNCLLYVDGEKIKAAVESIAGVACGRNSDGAPVGSFLHFMRQCLANGGKEALVECVGSQVESAVDFCGAIEGVQKNCIYQSYKCQDRRAAERTITMLGSFAARSGCQIAEKFNSTGPSVYRK